MRKISFVTDVHAPFRTIWEIMLDRVEHPPPQAMREVRIIERKGNCLLREVRARWLLFMERVTIDEGKREIRSMMQDHPLYLGSSTIRAVPLSRQSPVSRVRVSMVVEWIPKNQEAERTIIERIPAEIREEVLSIKDEAEERENLLQ